MIMGYKRLIIRSLTEFMDSVVNSSNGHPSELNDTWYRGHSNYYYHLEPSAYRHNNFFAHEPGSRIIEEKSINQAKTDLLHINETTRLNLDIDWLCYIQHYGVPTRLLDWTLEISVALYFAFENYLNKKERQEGLPCIWIFKPYVFIESLKNYISEDKNYPFGLNEEKKEKILTQLKNFPAKTHDFTDEELLDSVYAPILAPYVNERIKMQSGCFIRFPILNQEPEDRYKEYRLDKFIEDKEYFSDSFTQLIFIYPNEVAKALPMLNIEKKRFYPEVSNICESIKSKLFD